MKRRVPVSAHLTDTHTHTERLRAQPQHEPAGAGSGVVSARRNRRDGWTRPCAARGSVCPAPSTAAPPAVPVVADAAQDAQHQLQVSPQQVEPARAQRRRRRLPVPRHRGALARRRPAAAGGVVVGGELYAELTDEPAAFAHEELEARALGGRDAEAEAEARPERRIEEALPPVRAGGRGPQPVGGRQEGENVDH